MSAIYFNGYTKDSTGAYMVFINNDKIEKINLLNIEYIQDLIMDGEKLLKTKDGKEYVIYEATKRIDFTKLPDGFEWEKNIYKTTKWYDPGSGYSGKDYYYKFTLINKGAVLLANPEKLLNKLINACKNEEKIINE